MLGPTCTCMVELGGRGWLGRRTTQHSLGCCDMNFRSSEIKENLLLTQNLYKKIKAALIKFQGFDNIVKKENKMKEDERGEFGLPLCVISLLSLHNS